MNQQTINKSDDTRRFDSFPDVLTVPEASELLGVCTKTLYKLIREGKIKKVNVGRLFRIPKANISAYLGT